MSKKISVDDAINEYYKMKDKYETSYYEKYIRPIIKANNKSNREKRVEYSKLPKAECINCNRNVGTVFSINGKDSFTRTLTVRCGDMSNPCPLNINILSNKVITYEHEITIQEKDINRLKTDIIKEKYNIMFGYTDEEKGIRNFTDISSDLKDTTMLAGVVIEKNILVNDNPEKTELLKKSIDIFGNDYILQFKQMVKQYNDTGDVLVMNEAVKFYVNEMLPRLSEIQQLKYEDNFVEFETDSNEYKLYQRKNSLKNLEYAFETDTKVISFVKGVKDADIVDRGAKSKTSINGSKTKSKKKLVFVIEGETKEGEGEYGDIDYMPDSPPYNPSSPHVDLPYTIQGEIVTWHSPDYSAVWMGLSPKYKSELIKDPKWMTKTMDAFVENQKSVYANRSPRDFVLPLDLVLPPKVSEDKELDLGNTVINDLVARLAPIQKEILINSIPKPKNKNPTEKDMAQFLGILKPMLKSLVDFKAY